MLSVSETYCETRENSIEMRISSERTAFNLLSGKIVRLAHELKKKITLFYSQQPVNLENRALYRTKVKIRVTVQESCEG